MILWLVGMMGSGKTTIGRIIAGSLGLPFHDTDRAVEDGAGEQVAAIWEARGEKHFRRLETEAVAKLSASGPAVIATGGGAVLQPSSRERMRASGKVVWLRAGVDHLLDRLGDESGRPLLDSLDDRRETVQRLVAERTDIYLDLADYVVDVDGRTARSVASEIEAVWSS